MSDNRYGLDVDYFSKNLKLILRDIANYKPSELSRALKRLSDVAAPCGGVTRKEIEARKKELLK